MTYKKTVLANGITVVTDIMQGVRSIAAGLWFDVGTRDELQHEAGLAHFMEHMMFKGTKVRTAYEISSQFDAIGAEVNAFTSREYTCYYARCVDYDIETALSILADMVLNSEFSKETIETEREVVLEEIARADDTPDDVCFEQFTKAMLVDHPLGLPVLGTKEHVLSFTHDDCERFHKQHYVSQNLTIAVAGNVNHEQLVALCDDLFANMAQGEKSNRILRSDANRLSLVVSKKDIEQAHILYGLPFIRTNHPRRFAASVMSNMLGGTMSSRLFQEVRENLGLAYSIFTNPSSYLDLGTFAVYAGTRPENISRVVGIIRRELSKMALDGPTPEELKNTVDGICGQLLLGLESTTARMTRIGRGAVQNTDMLSPDDLVARYRSLTCDDVLQFARDFLYEPPTISIVSQFDEDQIVEMIKQ